MWTRRSWHECASELKAVSSRFRKAYLKDPAFDSRWHAETLTDSSIKGVELLRILALAIRSEQDAGLHSRIPAVVGAVNDDATQADQVYWPSHYRPPYKRLDNFRALKLRDALNKVAHADPTLSGFFADEKTHDLILCGRNQQKYWVAVFSLIELCEVIKCIPDRPIGSAVP